MNTRAKHCHQGKQKCPSPWLCSGGCNHGMTMVRRESPRDRAAEAFCDPMLQIDMAPDATDPAIAWVQRWAKHIGLGCAVVAALIFIGARL